ncbi:RNA polymerase sigma factor [Sphingobacterium chuzhouense]|uniref:Sigma-70 family RNA polymerase sigma factor n=1 Tax=Sphingobacterium chuzhouense TaxID=1742264 RepID=A0ABR7XME9_9SPHI|nr:sigma-70 family RNA polymerase sigma factor [Sphingobacterium chuzhouense]MBD1420345.1 sigma-70 family RNA polymerase sigma factor [Sphingobacterium chuzhouense]
MKSYHTIDEKELLVRFREGNKSAFEEIYNRYKIKLTGNLLRMLKSRELVEDVIQDIFMSLWMNRKSIDTERSLKPYLFRIAANKAKHIFRKAANEQKFKNFLLPHWQEDYNHIEELFNHRENKELLQSLLDKLSPQQKTIYTLCKIEGKSYREVSEALQISETTVNTHIRNANVVLRDLTAKDPEFLSGMFGLFLIFNLP